MCPNKKMTQIEALPDTWERSQTLQEQLVELIWSSLQHMTCCHPQIHPGITRVPFGCRQSLTGGVMIKKKKWGGANEAKMAQSAY